MRANWTPSSGSKRRQWQQLFFTAAIYSIQSVETVLYPLSECVVLLGSSEQLPWGVLAGCSSQLLQRLQQGLVLFLQLQQPAGRQVTHLLAQ